MNWKPIIGIEIHVELRTNTKMFCGCPADHFGAEPNTQTCPVCLGLPGALPVANAEGIRRTVLIGQAVGSTIAHHSKFDRKNYFYPDLPKGYQISQYDEPLCLGGEVWTSLGAVALERIHLEEDTAKLQHVTLTAAEMAEAKVEHADVSLVDFNRSGVALVELVTKPVIHSGEQAREYGKNLVQILRYLGVSDCDMEKGSLRLEANISVQSEAEQAANQLPPYKVEVKNLNSFRFLERSINYEVARQIELREAGQIPTQETRGWRDAENRTFSQRSKEDAQDYRYFPDPDLAPLELSDSYLADIRASLPELPHAKSLRFQQQYGLSEQNAEVIISERVVAELFETALQTAKSVGLNTQKFASAVVNKKVESWLLDPDRLVTATPSELEAEIQHVTQAVQSLYQTDAVSEDELATIIDTVLQDPANRDALEKYQSGKIQVIGVFIGQVMKKLEKKLDPAQVKMAIEKKI